MRRTRAAEDWIQMAQKQASPYTVGNLISDGEVIARRRGSNVLGASHLRQAVTERVHWTRCGQCHTCGTPTKKVLDGEEWCPTCEQYLRYRSHGSYEGPACCPRPRLPGS